jgi:hypothetical protein
MENGATPLIDAGEHSGSSAADWRLRASLAANVGCPWDVLSILGQSESYWVRLNTAGNRSSGPDALATLASDVEQNVRAAVGRNPSAPLPLLTELMDRDEPRQSNLRAARPWPGNKNVSAAVLSNPVCPIAILEEFTEDADCRMRATVARNVSCTTDLMAMLAQDPCRDARRAVAENANCPPPLLELLASDSQWTVEVAAVRNPECPEKVIRAAINRKPLLWLRVSAAENPTCPPDSLEVLSRGRESVVRMAVARNSRADPQIVGRLVGDDDLGVSLFAIANPNCPGSLLLQCSKSEKKSVRSAVAASAACPPELLNILAQDREARVRSDVAGNPRFAPDRIARSANDPSREVLVAAAWNIACPSQTLSDLALHWDAGVRAVVARNPNCPLPTVMALLSDTEFSVREAIAGFSAQQVVLSRLFDEIVWQIE